MQSVSSRIWTRVTVSISYDDNHYTTGTSIKVDQLLFKYSQIFRARVEPLKILYLMYIFFSDIEMSFTWKAKVFKHLALYFELFLHLL